MIALEYLVSIFIGAVSVALLVVGCGCLVVPQRMIARGFVQMPRFVVLEGVAWISLSLLGFSFAFGT